MKMLGVPYSEDDIEVASKTPASRRRNRRHDHKNTYRPKGTASLRRQAGDCLDRLFEQARQRYRSTAATRRESDPAAKVPTAEAGASTKRKPTYYDGIARKARRSVAGRPDGPGGGRIYCHRCMDDATTEGEYRGRMRICGRTSKQPSFPRSAWERTVRPLRGHVTVTVQALTRSVRPARSDAERGNEEIAS